MVLQNVWSFWWIQEASFLKLFKFPFYQSTQRLETSFGEFVMKRQTHVSHIRLTPVWHIKGCTSVPLWSHWTWSWRPKRMERHCWLFLGTSRLAKLNEWRVSFWGDPKFCDCSKVNSTPFVKRQYSSKRVEIHRRDPASSPWHVHWNFSCKPTRSCEFAVFHGRLWKSVEFLTVNTRC